MSKTKRVKCRSSQIPCPAGDRCPEHRGRAQAIVEALENSNIPAALLLRKEELDRQEKAQVAKFLSSMNLKFKRDGTTVITLDGDKKNQMVIKPLHPAEAIDKTHRIVPNNQTHFYEGTVRKTQDEQMQEALDELYDGNVQVETKNHLGYVSIDKLDVTDEYKGHGVESHVLASIVVERRHDLYNFASKENIPYTEYAKAGFEPNPYYWAGKTHPETGITYPPAAELDKLSNDRKNPNNWEYKYHNLWESKNTIEYPYVRFKYGYRFSEVPLTKAPVNQDELKKVKDAQEERWDRAQAGRSSHNVLDLH